MSRIGMIGLLIVCYAAVAFGQSSAAPSPVAPPNSAQTARPVVVATGVMLGRVDHKTMPVYPDEAMKKGVQGNVIFKIEVDESGKITSSVPVEGNPMLVAASVDALRTFHFRPYMLDGVAVKVRSQLGFQFSVEKLGDGVNAHVECIASIPNRP